MTELNELAAALVAAQAELKNPPMDSTNPHFRSKFASLLACESTVRPVLAKHGLAVVQRLGGDGDVVTVETLLVHASGQVLPCGTATARPDKGGPQAAGSACTYLRRYGLLAALSLVGDPDDDAEAADDHGEKPSKPAKPTNPREGSAVAAQIADLAQARWGDEWTVRLSEFCTGGGFPSRVAEMDLGQRKTVLRSLQDMAKGDA